MTILDEIKKRAGGAADTGVNIADALAKEGDMNHLAGEPIATVMRAIETKATLSYDANTGTGDIPDVVAYDGVIITLDDGSTLTPPEGKIFAGWGLEDDSAEALPSKITIAEDTTVYAIWEDAPEPEPELEPGSEET